MRRDPVNWLASAAFVAIAMAVPLTRHCVPRSWGSGSLYTYGSIVLLLSAVALTRLWPAADSDKDLRWYRWPIAWIGGAALAFGLCLWTASALLPAMFAGPLAYLPGRHAPRHRRGRPRVPRRQNPLHHVRNTFRGGPYATVRTFAFGCRSRCRSSPTAISAPHASRLPHSPLRVLLCHRVLRGGPAVDAVDGRWAGLTLLLAAHPTSTSSIRSPTPLV